MQRFNWNQIWKDTLKPEDKNKATEFWDNHAEHFFRKVEDGKKDPYIEKFYELSGLKAGETIFDMGCASGTLAIPFAQKGHEVYAADFSNEMLKYLMEGAAEAGVADNIHPIHLDWNEDWGARDLPKCDVAIASRSLIFYDMTSSLKKLESVAKSRVCIGAWDNPAPGYDRYLAGAVGYERPGYGVHYFVMNELMDRDMFPELTFIYAPFRPTKYKTREEALEKLRNTFNFGLNDEQEKLFNEYCDEHLKFNRVEDGGRTSSRGDAQGSKEYWQMDHSDMSTIAFIKYPIK